MVLALTAPSNIQAEDDLDTVSVDRHSFVRSLGIPAGYMDWSANMRLNLALTDGYPVRPEITFHETFSAKKSEGDWLMVNVLAGYFLLRYNFAPSGNKWVPFVSGGGGVHYMLSRDDRGLVWGKTLYHYITAKAHGFAGVEWAVKPNRFLIAQIRATYPSDRILDAAYIGYGIRF